MKKVREKDMGQDKRIADKLRKNVYEALEQRDFGRAEKALRKLLPYAGTETMELMVSLEIERGNPKAAEKAFQRLRENLKELTPYQSFLGARVLFLQNRVMEALDIMNGVEIPRAEPPQREMLYNLLGQCCRFLGESRRSVNAYFRAFEAARSRELAALEYSNYLFNLHYLPVAVPDQRKAAEGYQEIFEKTPWFSHSLPSAEKKKLRIGYISPDLRNHVVLRFTYVLFARYDHDCFEVFLYANNPEDGYSRHLASMADGWRNISGYSAEEAARLIHKDGIDILVDLAGHTKNNCLPVLAHKPAPIQISGIGYFASTGLKAVDYFLGDVHLDTEEAEQGFTEELLLLPHSHFCYAELEIAEPVPEPPCKRNGYITFGSFNNFTKVNDAVLRLWGKILQRLPDARLLLKADIFSRDDSREAALCRMKAAGIPMERVETRGVTTEYISEYGDMDIALDTFPYPGGGTTCDALYMSVPVITLRGKSHGERFGSSLLENLGLEELCADTEEIYADKAVGLAQDRELVEMLHQNIRNMLRQSPVMNAPLYMDSIQCAYRAVWERYAEGSNPPAGGERDFSERIGI